MKIGIVRHFRVDYKPKKFMNSVNFIEFTNDYDKAKVIKNEMDLGNIKWNKCYCSDLERAIYTAKDIYKENLEITSLLREVRMYPFKESKIKMPTFLWSISSRIAWKTNNKSQLEGIDSTRKRAKEFLKMIDINSEENILIVSHGFFLITLIEELKSLGFKGDISKRMKNGWVYILEL